MVRCTSFGLTGRTSTKLNRSNGLRRNQKPRKNKRKSGISLTTRGKPSWMRWKQKQKRNKNELVTRVISFANKTKKSCNVSSSFNSRKKKSLTERIITHNKYHHQNSIVYQDGRTNRIVCRPSLGTRIWISPNKMRWDSTILARQSSYIDKRS